MSRKLGQIGVDLAAAHLGVRIQIAEIKLCAMAVLSRSHNNEERLVERGSFNRRGSCC